MRHALVVALSLGFLAGTTSVSDAQLPARTWVSGVGNDANPCSRSLPCLTFASALSKTAANGEINCLDPGSFGAVYIDKSITIDCSGVVGGLSGVRVVAGDDDVVILRNLEINGSGTGSVGVQFSNGKLLIIENTKIFGFLSASVHVVSLNDGSSQNVVISNSTISTTGSAGIGVMTEFGNTVVSHSVITGNARAGLWSVWRGVINADSNLLTFNGVAVQAGSGQNGQIATVRLSNNDVYGNLTGFGCGGGVLASAGNNRKGSNTGGTVATCAPNATITQQ